jgi:hypothetical protein
MAKISITMTLPDFFDIRKLEAAAVKAVNDTLDEVEKDYLSSVKDFSPRSVPIFTKKKATVRGNVISGSVGTDNENYARLNFGTTGHFVPRSGKRRMTFYEGYKKKTRRGRIPSVDGGGRGNLISRRGRWWVSGIDPRRFDETIAVANEQVLKANIEKQLATLT